MSNNKALSVAAHVTGVVLEIKVVVGDAVGTGDVLMIIESMKMHMPLEAASGGVVDSLEVSTGDFVEEDQVVMMLKPLS